MTKTARSRERFSETAQLRADDQKKLTKTLAFDHLCNISRLAGFCLVPEGSRAHCLNDNPAIAATLAELKPSLTWTKDKTADLMVGDGILQAALVKNKGSWKAVRAYLRDILETLPIGGRLVLRENAMLVPEEMVLLELPDYRSKLGKKDPSQLAIKRLQQFSKIARPWLAEDYQGFFLEEVPEMRPDTRLFNLPMKWASEFLLRKDMSDKSWDENLGRELIIGNERMLRTQVLNPLGLRVILHAPHWDKEAYDKPRGFALYKENDRSQTLPPPPTEMVIVAEKIAEATDNDTLGLWLGEQRADRDGPHELSLLTVQNDKTGEAQTLVTGLEPDIQILPWRYLSEDRIGIYLKKEIAAPLANAKPRAANTIDSRRFSGYLPSIIHMPADDWDRYQKGGAKAIGKWLNFETGLDLAPLSEVFEGKMSYPAPDFIDQAMCTIFAEVKAPTGEIVDYACFDANDLLHAIHSGLLPLSSLEPQLWQLAKMAKIHLNLIGDKKVSLPIDHAADERLEEGDFEAMCRQLAADEDEPEVSPYSNLRGNNGDWRIARSVFVEETSDGPRRAIDKEFVLSDEEPLHKAALFCLSHRMNGEVFAGFEMEDCPVPTRYGKPGKMLRVPTVPLPNNLRSIPEAREYLAKVLEVEVHEVVPCGQSMFTHLDVTQQKIFPFVILRSPWYKHWKLTYFTLGKIKWITDLDNTDSFLWVWGLALKQLNDNSEIAMVNNWDKRSELRERSVVPDMQLRVIAKNYA